MSGEILPGNQDYVNDEGDIMPIDRSDFVHQEWTPDHVVSGSVELQFIAPNIQPIEAKAEIGQDSVEKLSPQGRQERLMYLEENEGFFPQNNKEFNRVMLMSGNADTPRRALIHLDEVQTRQLNLFLRKEMAAKSVTASGIANPEANDGKKKLTPKEEAVRTLHSIVREFKEYAQDARALRFFVGSLRDTLQDLDISNLTSFKNIPQMQDWKYDGGTSRALMAVAKYIETKDFVANDGKDLLGKRVIIDNDKNREARIASRVDNLRLSEISSYCRTVAEEQSTRYDYWVNRLHESTKHMYVRGQAYQALRDLGAIES